MAEFLEKHWDLINWPTALIAVVILTPITAALFTLIASHSRELLKAEREAHKKTESARDALTDETKALRRKNSSLLSKVQVHERREDRSDVELTKEEQIVLVAISADQMNELYRSKKLSDQRISLAQDRLIKVDFIAWGTEGTYAMPAGREWLDAHGLLK